MSNKIKIKATYVNGEVHISLTTLKHILSTDLISNLETENRNEPTLTSTEYIKDLIERLDKMADAIPEKKNWWDK